MINVVLLHRPRRPFGVAMSDSVQPGNNGAPLNPEQVVDFLRANPSFFVEHEYLLKEIKLPHISGRAISLVERQLTLFREQRDLYLQQLSDLIDVARENDRFFRQKQKTSHEFAGCQIFR